MISEAQRTSRLINELVGYFHHHGVLDYRIDVRQSERETRLSIEGACAEEPGDIEQVRGHLASGRSLEMETVYDELLGIYEESPEMELLGYMVDEAEVRYRDGRLSIELLRRF